MSVLILRLVLGMLGVREASGNRVLDKELGQQPQDSPGKQHAEPTVVLWGRRRGGGGALLFSPQMHAPVVQYVRVSSDTPPRVIFHLMTQHWGLDPPNLLISVTGGAKNFIMKPRLKNIFRQGLVKVAQTTGKRCRGSHCKVGEGPAFWP